MESFNGDYNLEPSQFSLSDFPPGSSMYPDPSMYTDFSNMSLPLNMRLGDQVYQECLAELNSLRSDNSTFDMQSETFPPNPTNKSQSTGPSTSFVVSTPEDFSAPVPHRRGNGHGNLGVKFTKEQKAERRRQQNRDAQRSFRARKSETLQRMSGNLLSAMLEIKHLRQQKVMWESMAREQQAKVRELENEIVTMKMRCYCHWAPAEGTGA